MMSRAKQGEKGDWSQTDSARQKQIRPDFVKILEDTGESRLDYSEHIAV